MLPSALVIVLVCLGIGSMARFVGAAPPPLSEVQVIALPAVERRIDHLAIDPAGKRLFVAALGNGSVEVLDLAAGTRITSLTGLKEPQGVAYIPQLHRIVVAMRGGSIAAFDAGTYQRTGVLLNLGDSDNLRYDAASGQLYLGYGEGALGVIDPSSLKLVASIPTGGHPESFRLEENGPRVFVNVPPRREILIIDRRQKTVVKHVPLGKLSNNYPMFLDENGHRLFVGVRKPAELLVFDTVSDERIAEVPCVGDTDDLFLDAHRDRVYIIGGEGYVDVINAATRSYDRLARIATRSGARTGLWSSELDRLFVAWPSREGHPAEVHVLAPPAGT